jgi:hypothetical protein
MSKTLEPVTRVGQVAFELDRFELVGGDRCELEGRWFGVRGRRFMRPSLTVMADGQANRLLADLEHKPWPTEDGQPWVAAFPWTLDGAELLESELTVSPDITVVLPAPGSRRTSRKTQVARPRDAPAQRPTDHEPGRYQRRQDGSDQELLPRLTRQLAAAQEAQRRLERELERAEAEKGQAASRIDELLGERNQAARDREAARGVGDRLEGELEALQRERDRLTVELAALGHEGNALARERDAARQARDDAVQASQEAAVARDAGAAERGTALVARARAEAERDAALAAQAQAESERDTALSVRDHALSERHAALAARDAAVRERDALSATNQRLQSELADHIASHGAALVMRRAAMEPPTFRTYAGLVPRGIAVIVLLAVVVVVLIILGVV